jgi:RNA polymerase primary sigma factor|tara:strand:- start:244 stop:423 length:180 start_codon:yes stop_codon:yes gene_type:complete
MITETQLKELSPREERILRMKYGIGKTTKHSLSEIGLQFSQSENEIKKIVTNAEKKIKK